MDVSLKPWLHDQIHTSLELGHSWLEEQHRLKTERNKHSAAFDRKWEGIYHDNGSCIDIVGPFSSVQAQVVVLQANPLLISDGHHQIEPTLTNACRENLLLQHSPPTITVGTVLIVKKYILRYTSYGPPRIRLRLILDTLVLAGCDNSQARITVDPANALIHSVEITSTLRLLDRTRSRQDTRCLHSHAKEEEVEDPNPGAYTMAGADEPLDEDTSMNTQMPFGTQMPHSIRPRRDDDVSFVGINRMEPVLAGNTQRAELKPRSGTAVNREKLLAGTLQRDELKQQRAGTTDISRDRLVAGNIQRAELKPRSATTENSREKLLALLHRTAPPVPPQPASRHHAESPSRPNIAKDHTVISPSQPRGSPSKRTNRDSFEDSHAGAVQTPSNYSKKRRRDSDNDSPSIRQPAHNASFSENEPRQGTASEMDKFAAECSWMKGLKLNRASTNVPDDQALLLQKPESWYKPEPGQRSVNEVPVQILVVLSRMADEAAALEGATSSGSYHDTDPSSASYPANSAPQPIDEDSSESEEEAPTSPISWQTSPSPEPPRRPTPSRQGLPPDSSLEMPQDDADVVRSQPVKRHNQTLHRSFPNSSHDHEADLPPSSPPARQPAIDSDDDMDMETSVPQALGEDSQPHAATRQQTYQSRATSVVQVKETPYVKGKNGQQPVVTVSPPTQSSNEQSSSASVVRGTYADLSSSAVEETRLDALGKVGEQDQRGSISKCQTHLRTTQPPHDQDAQDTSMFDNFMDEPVLDLGPQSNRKALTIPAQTNSIQQSRLLHPEPTPMSAQQPRKDSSSGEQAATTPTKAALPAQVEMDTTRRASATPSLTKRKRQTGSPGDRKHRLGRTLKKVKFGSGRHKVDGERQSTTSAESRQGSVSNPQVLQSNANAEDADAKNLTESEAAETIAVGEPEMSPRHQSLYAPPSPIMRPAAIAVVESRSKDGEAAQIQEQVSGEGTVVSEAVETVTSRQLQPQSPPKSSPERPQEPRSMSVSAPAPMSGITPASEPQQQKREVPVKAERTPSAPIDDAGSATVFETFKAKYPEYKGIVKHFINQCKLIEKLDREDKMVPKWAWDDFIIRNQTDYKPYVNDCLEAGEDPTPYIRFYKDDLGQPIYKRGVINTRTALLQALQELGVRPDTAEASPLPPQDQPSHQSPPPTSQDPRPARHSRQQPLQQPHHSTRPPHQQPHRQSDFRMPPPSTKKSRKSLPFPVPVASTSTPSRSIPRHSLPPRSSAPSSSAHTKSRISTFGSTLRNYKREMTSEEEGEGRVSGSVSAGGSGNGNEYRDFINAQKRMASWTGDLRVNPSKPWPESLEGRRSVSSADVSRPKKKVDVLSWGDEL